MDKEIQKFEKTISWLKAKKCNLIDRDVKGTSGLKDRLIGFFISLIALCIMAVVSYFSWRQGRELAKLKHQKDLLKETLRQHDLNKQMAIFDKDRSFLERDSKIIKENIIDLDKSIEQHENTRRLLTGKIANITSWEDVDKLMESLNNANEK